MKSWKNLWERFCTWENFVEAYNNAKRNKAFQAQVTNFSQNWESNLREIWQTTINGGFHSSNYESKLIYEPKERIIYILPFAPDRIVHHALLNVLIPYFNLYFIQDSYACVDGRGQMKASQRIMESLRRNRFCLESDLHHAYPSVIQKNLSDMYHEKIPDERFMNVMDDIIFNFPGEHPNKKLILPPDYVEGTNLPIGNVTSQWGFNFYLTKFDLFCKHELGIRDYIRFSDNFDSFSNDKYLLHEWQERQTEYLHNMGFTLSKSNILNVKQGVDFVGYRHFVNDEQPNKGYVLVRKSTATRLKQKMKEIPKRFEDGKLTEDELRSKLDSFSGWIGHANTHNLSVSVKIQEIRDKYVSKPKKKHRKKVNRRLNNVQYTSIVKLNNYHRKEVPANA